VAAQGKDRGFQLVGDSGEPEPEQGGRPAGSLPPIGFGTLVLSLSASALVHLGVAPSPEAAGEEAGPAPAPNLVLAQQTIDILEMLQEKTRGNLDPDEARLLESVLHDLRMRFVEVHEKAAR
jgi:hypothetical protein